MPLDPATILALTVPASAAWVAVTWIGTRRDASQRQLAEMSARVDVAVDNAAAARDGFRIAEREQEQQARTLRDLQDAQARDREQISLLANRGP